MVEALSTSGSERGYPPSIGSVALRSAIVDWIRRRFTVEVDPAAVAACVGTKEFVGTLPQWLKLRTPERDTILYPSVAYPTYEMGAILAGCRPVPVAMTPDGRLDLDSVSPTDADRALALWVNSPGNPTGACDDLGRIAEWGRRHGVPVFSDECYVEFIWDGPPQSILQHGLDGVVAVHSLSKRSNLAGARLGFYAGDPELVDYLQQVRKHVGMMVPGPTQAAGVVALNDDAHVAVQRDRYRAAPRPHGRDPGRLDQYRDRRSRTAASTSGSRSTTAGRSPSVSPPRAVRSAAPASSTARRATISCASPSSSPTIASSSSASASDHRGLHWRTPVGTNDAGPSRYAFLPRVASASRQSLRMTVTTRP